MQEKSVMEKASKVEGKIEKQVDKIIEKEIDRSKEVKVKTKKEQGEIKEEVKKQMGEKFLKGAKKSAGRLRNEFRKQTSTAITAAFAFLIALSWREPISETVQVAVSRFGLDGSIIYYKYLTAFIVTVIAVLFLVAISHWVSRE